MSADEDEEAGLGLAALLPPGMRRERRKVDIKQRMANILSQARPLLHFCAAVLRHCW